MKHLVMSLTIAAAVTFTVFASAPVQAQSTRTWVSGVGDDANPCSRTAPCKTFAGAISKTSATGEINCLDPGGYGSVTITKSITIDCDHTEGGTHAGGTSGITIDAPADAVVRLRGLSIRGFSAVNGVRFVDGGALYLDRVSIARFATANSWGVLFQPAGASELFINDSLVIDNGNPAVPATAGGGILIQPTGVGGSARVFLKNVQLVNNSQGLRADSSGSTHPNPIKVSVKDSTASHNAYAGFTAFAAASVPVVMMVDGSAATYNGGAGFAANGVNAQIRLGRSVATGNGTGTLQVNSGVVGSYQTNQISDNANNGSRVSVNQD